MTSSRSGASRNTSPRSIWVSQSKTRIHTKVRLPLRMWAGVGASANDSFFVSKTLSFFLKCKLRGRARKLKLLISMKSCQKQCKLLTRRDIAEKVAQQHIWQTEHPFPRRCLFAHQTDFVWNLFKPLVLSRRRLAKWLI